MSRKQWKALALSLITLLASLSILIGITPIGKVLAQRSPVQQCVSPTDWIFQAAQSLNERYDVDVCQKGRFRLGEPVIRADMAGWLAKVMDSFSEKAFEPALKDLAKKGEFDQLNQELDRITAQVEALEKR